RRVARPTRTRRRARARPGPRGAQRPDATADPTAVGAGACGRSDRGRTARPDHLRRAARSGRCSMSAPQLERLHAQMVRLRLFKSRERIEAMLQEATGSELSYAELLDRLLTEEVTSKSSKNVTMRTSLARFPFVKSLDAFDFSYQPSIDRKQLQMLASCHFIEHGEN